MAKVRNWKKGNMKIIIFYNTSSLQVNYHILQVVGPYTTFITQIH